MRVVHVSRSDSSGGAARAAYRIHRALLAEGVDSSMRVLDRRSADPTVDGRQPVGNLTLSRRVQRHLARIQLSRFKTGNPILHSQAWPGSGLGDELNLGSADIIHLHWLGYGTLSVEEIGRLKPPVVWTLHDMWAFCGAEHLSNDTPDSRFRAGYQQGNAPADEQEWDLNRWVWRRKQKSWRNAMSIVCPSKWLASCARESNLMSAWPVTTIPNPIDFRRWFPVDRRLARQFLGLHQDARYALLGAEGGLAEPHKGADLAIEALNCLSGQGHSDLRLAVFGQSNGSGYSNLTVPTDFLGTVRDDIRLVMAYCAADVFVAPSRQDNLPNTAVEAHACGTPVVAFGIGGLADIVTHQETGWLAKPFDTEELAAGIQWVIEDDFRRAKLGENARRVALERYSEQVVARRYMDIYAAALRAKTAPIA